MNTEGSDAALLHYMWVNSVIHYVKDGVLRWGTTLCGLQVTAHMGVVATKPSELRYVTCSECKALLIARLENSAL